MVSHLLKTALIIFILSQLLSSANNSINWQKLDHHSAIIVSAGQGAFIDIQEQNLLFLSGIVAGIFAAAQSTVSTSMNSIASTLATDFIRPFNLVKKEKAI